MKYALLWSAFIILFICTLLMYYLQVEFQFWRENERYAFEAPCRLSETSNGLSETMPSLSETSNGLSENSPLLSERVINKRTRTAKTRGSLKSFLAGPFCFYTNTLSPVFKILPRLSFKRIDFFMIPFSNCSIVVLSPLLFNGSTFIISSNCLRTG
jgi:hypothetical protein